MLVLLSALTVLCGGSELAHQPHEGCATSRDGHELSSLLQNRITQKTKPRRAATLAEQVHPEHVPSDNNTLPSVNSTSAPQASSAPSAPASGPVLTAISNMSVSTAAAPLTLAAVHETVLAHMLLWKSQYQKYGLSHSSTLLIIIFIKIVALGAFCLVLVMCCRRMTSRVRHQSPICSPMVVQHRSPHMSLSAQRMHPTPLLPSQNATLRASPTAPSVASLAASNSPIHPARIMASRHGPLNSSLHAELVLPDDQEVLLAVPSLSNLRLDSPAEYPIANKDGIPMLRTTTSRGNEGGAICERIGISLWGEDNEISFCKLWPDKVRMNSVKNINDALVGSIFRSTGELYANIIRVTFAISSSNLPVGEFIVKSPTGPPWQFLLQNRGSQLMIVDMDGRPHGTVMSGVDLSFEKSHIQYYQLHGLAGTDLCLLLMMVMAIDRLTFLSKS